jgi:hypothetical protein
MTPFISQKTWLSNRYFVKRDNRIFDGINGINGIDGIEEEEPEKYLRKSRKICWGMLLILR